MGLIARFLSGYTENFLVAVALWPLASAALTLPILAWLYHRDGRLRFGSAVSTYLAVLYVLGLGCFTLWPLPSGDSGLGITYGVPWQLDPLAFGTLSCQVISNVPSAVLLSKFTGDYARLLVAVNIGGLGTPIASLASLITLNTYRRVRPGETKKYILKFLLINFSFLAVLIGAGYLTAAIL